MKKGMQWSTQRATIVLHEFRGHAEFRVQPVLNQGLMEMEQKSHQWNKYADDIKIYSKSSGLGRNEEPGEFKMESSSSFIIYGEF